MQVSRNPHITCGCENYTQVQTLSLEIPQIDNNASRLNYVWLYRPQASTTAIICPWLTEWVMAMSEWLSYTFGGSTKCWIFPTGWCADLVITVSNVSSRVFTADPRQFSATTVTSSLEFRQANRSVRNSLLAWYKYSTQPCHLERCPFFGFFCMYVLSEMGDTWPWEVK